MGNVTPFWNGSATILNSLGWLNMVFFLKISTSMIFLSTTFLLPATHSRRLWRLKLRSWLKTKPPSLQPISTVENSKSTVRISQYHCYNSLESFLKWKINNSLPRKKSKRETKSVTPPCFSHLLCFSVTNYFAASGFKKLTEITEKDASTGCETSHYTSPNHPSRKDEDPTTFTTSRWWRSSTFEPPISCC